MAKPYSFEHVIKLLEQASNELHILESSGMGFSVELEKLWKQITCYIQRHYHLKSVIKKSKEES